MLYYKKEDKFKLSEDRVKKIEGSPLKNQADGHLALCPKVLSSIPDQFKF